MPGSSDSRCVPRSASLARLQTHASFLSAADGDSFSAGGAGAGAASPWSAGAAGAAHPGACGGLHGAGALQVAFFGAHAGLHGAHFATGAAQLGFALQHFGLLDLHNSSLGMLIFGMHSLGSSSFGRQTFGSSIFGSLKVGQPQSPADAGALRATRAARDRTEIASFFMRLSPCDLFEGNEQGHRLPFHGTSE